MKTQEIDKHLKAISDQESDLLEKLNGLKEEDKKYEVELEALNKEANEIEASEQQYWERISEFESKLLDTEEESGKVKSALAHISQEYQRLASINVVNDSFKISCPERVAAINGFRLGRLQTEDVDCSQAIIPNRLSGKKSMLHLDKWLHSLQFYLQNLTSKILNTI